MLYQKISGFSQRVFVNCKLLVCVCLPWSSRRCQGHVKIICIYLFTLIFLRSSFLFILSFSFLVYCICSFLHCMRGLWDIFSCMFIFFSFFFFFPSPLLHIIFSYFYHICAVKIILAYWFILFLFLLAFSLFRSSSVFFPSVFYQVRVVETNFTYVVFFPCPFLFVYFVFFSFKYLFNTCVPNEYVKVFPSD